MWNSITGHIAACSFTPVGRAGSVTPILKAQTHDNKPLAAVVMSFFHFPMSPRHFIFQVTPTWCLHLG